MTKTIAFFAHALPAARTAAGDPARSANSAYDIVLPALTLRIAFHAACENGAPGCLTLIASIAVISPSK